VCKECYQKKSRGHVGRARKRRRMNELKNIKLRNLLKVLLNSLLWGFIIAPAYYNRFLNIQADILKIGGKKT